MSYQVFARKYRPQHFDEVIGQEAAVTTLKNAIDLKRIHHAYLFCGARGVGKTSLARIFAKSLNCEKGPTTTPCQTCSSCVGITKGTSMDVLEIDGASNTSVNDVRELREQTKFLPSHGKYKIYIIDEVHMLSTSAFNALLKTLEEPPPHIIFVFATTEPHKIPITILSRCQRFDLKRLPQDKLAGHLKNIMSQEKVTLDDESIHLLIGASEGSVRDSLSLLDQVISFCGNHPSSEQIRDILGLADRVLLLETLRAILSEDIGHALKQVEGLFNKGFDLKIFAEGLLELLRDALIVKESPLSPTSLSQQENENLKDWTQKIPSTHLLILFQILLRGTEEISRSSLPKIVFETTLIKMMKVRELVSIPELVEKLNAENNPPNMVRLSLQPEPATSNQQSSPPSSTHERPATSQPSPDLHSLWRSFVQKVLETRPQIGAILEHARPLKKVENLISLGFDPQSIYPDMLKDRLKTIEEMAVGFFKQQIHFSLEKSAENQKQGGPTVAQQKQEEQIQRSTKLREDALNDPSIKLAQEILGAKVKEIREIK